MKLEFSKISKLIPQSESTWQDKIFITFDIDWASDFVLEEVISLIENLKIPSTWFITHSTPLINRLRKNPLFELGIHPNFNFLLEGSPQNGKNAEEVIDQLFEIVPEALSIRSHSMTQSTILQDIFLKKGITHDANHFIPVQSNITLKPWVLWNGLIKVPYFWEDDLHCMYKETIPCVNFLEWSGIKVFNFHPIHIYLNTDHLQRYENSRDFHNSSELTNFRNIKSIGIKDHLLQLIERVSR